jgi:hypothetical protein
MQCSYLDFVFVYITELTSTESVVSASPILISILGRSYPPVIPQSAFILVLSISLAVFPLEVFVLCAKCI